MANFRMRKSGHWQVQVRKKGYPTQTKSFRSKAAGAQWVRSIEYKMDQGLFMSRNEAETTTLGELLNRYLRECTESVAGFAWNGGPESVEYAQSEHPFRFNMNTCSGRT
jgi:hypothetical protein